MAKYLWIAVPVVFIVLMVWCLYRHIRKMSEALGVKRPRLAALVAAVLLMLPVCNLWGAFYWVMLVMHFCVFCLVADGVDAAVRRFRRGGGAGVAARVWGRLHTFMVPPLLCTVAVALYGYVNIHDVRRTEYTVTTAKPIPVEGYRIALLADIHYGLLDNREAIRHMADTLSRENPDLVIICGDMTDERSTLEGVREICRILGGIKTRLGVYYVMGNHDTARYSSHPPFTAEDLQDALREGGVTLLADAAVSPEPGLVLVGRMDRSFPRARVEEVLQGVDTSAYIILADHQPYEMAEKAAAGVDLQVSGHTHSGQIFPVGHLCSLLHIGDVNYGLAEFGAMRAIVTSGVTGWGGPIRTQNHSEYVIIHVRR